MVDNKVVFDEISKAWALTSCFILALSYILVFYIKKSPYHRYVSEIDFEKVNEHSSEKDQSDCFICLYEFHGIWVDSMQYLVTHLILLCYNNKGIKGPEDK